MVSSRNFFQKIPLIRLTINSVKNWYTISGGFLFWNIRESSLSAARTLFIVRNSIVLNVNDTVVRRAIDLQVGEDIE